MPPDPTTHPSARAGWLYIRAFWASLSIMTMWLVVLLVGIFGDDFVVNNSNGLTKIPVVVFLLPFVLPGTIVIARRAFASSAADIAPIPDSEAQAPDVEGAVPAAFHAEAA
jgi:hypothetical protein